MKKMFLRIFQREVERQCQFALIAVNDLKQALRLGDMDRIWSSTQSFLVAVGNVSKLLWPSKSIFPNRREELRKSLSVNDDSPLEPRTFRNHFEHFDERLEQWIKMSEGHSYADSNVGPHDMISGLKPTDYLRHFDPTTFTITFRGDVYQLQPIIDAIIELWKKASVEANKPHWEE